jgi:hypothetical protein
MSCFSEVSGCSYDAETVGAMSRLRAERFLPQAVYAEAQRVLDESYLVKSYLDRYASEHRSPHRMGLGLDPDDVPLVSVLMRSMDRDTRAEALDSVALQTYPNAEVIVANARGVGTVCRFPLGFLDSEQPLHRSVVANRLFLAARGQWRRTGTLVFQAAGHEICIRDALMLTRDVPITHDKDKITHARERLGWSPQVALTDGIRMMLFDLPRA